MCFHKQTQDHQSFKEAEGKKKNFPCFITPDIWCFERVTDLLLSVLWNEECDCVKVTRNQLDNL